MISALTSAASFQCGLCTVAAGDTGCICQIPFRLLAQAEPGEGELMHMDGTMQHGEHKFDRCPSILVSLGRLFGQQILTVHPHSNPACIQLRQQVLAADRLFGSGATLPAPGTMTGSAKTLLH